MPGHMRAGAWSAIRGIDAAPVSWKRARQIADSLPTDDPDHTAMRIAPRTLMCLSAFRVNVKTSDAGFEELRELCMAAGDKASLAIAMGGLVGERSAPQKSLVRPVRIFPNWPNPRCSARTWMRTPAASCGTSSLPRLAEQSRGERLVRSTMIVVTNCELLESQGRRCHAEPHRSNRYWIAGLRDLESTRPGAGNLSRRRDSGQARPRCGVVPTRCRPAHTAAGRTARRVDLHRRSLFGRCESGERLRVVDGRRVDRRLQRCTLE